MTDMESEKDQSMDIGQDQMANSHRNSRRHAWIQKRWKNAFRQVATIGFKTFEEFLRLPSDEIDSSGETSTSSHELSHLLENCQKKCRVCKEESQPDDQAVQQCQKCQIVVHSNCQNSIACAASSSKSLSKNKNSGDNNKHQQQRAHTQDDLSNCQDETNNEVDPIYLALKKGNKMANLRKSSLVDCSRGLSQTREITPTADSIVSSSRLAPGPAPVPTNNSKAGMSSCSSYTSCASVSSANAIPRSSPAENVTSSSKQVGSAPNLLAQKSIESADEVGPIRKPAALQKTARRAPKLDSKMKSLSLDCADSSNSRKSSITPNLIPNRHALRVPPCKYSSFESDDTAQSSNSGSPCPSSICGSTLTLPSNSYAVTHDYYAKFPEEIDLRVGERVLVVDNSDQDWWQGHNITGRLGIFPSTCVAHIHCNEQVMQVVQNVCLWVGNKNTRLYRDQIVFAQLDEFVAEGLVTVRTERDHRINCPLQYLMSLE